jgi:hypothetical protein
MKPQSPSARSSTSSLAAVQPGHVVQVRSFLFGAARVNAVAVGLHEGDVVRCRGRVGTSLLLATSSGASLLLDGDWARYIAVEHLPASQQGTEPSSQERP